VCEVVIEFFGVVMFEAGLRAAEVKRSVLGNSTKSPLRGAACSLDDQCAELWRSVRSLRGARDDCCPSVID
jgi:hypothetical protein